MLFAAVNVARKLRVDPELALRATSQRFRDRVERAEELARAEGKEFTRLALGSRLIDYNGRFCMSAAATASNRSLGLDRGLPNLRQPVTEWLASQ